MGFLRDAENRTSTSRLIHTCSSRRMNVVMRVMSSGEAANWDGVGQGRNRVYGFDATCYMGVSILD